MSNNNPGEIITDFYAALNDRDYNRMNQHYHPNTEFKDPVFHLHGDEVRAMWQMLCERGKDLNVSHKIVSVNGNEVIGKLTADYTFTKTNRKVTNEITGYFLFEGDKIIRHVDEFNFYRWSKMAFGFAGFLFGWTRWFQKTVQKKSYSLLKKFKEKRKI